MILEWHHPTAQTSFVLIPEDWETIYKSFLPNNTMPLEVENETPEVIRGFVDRIDHGWDFLKTKLESYAPDALVIVGGDQQEMFDERQRPQILLYAGEDASGELGADTLFRSATN